MTNPKIRKTLVTLHLLFAGFLTPAFLLVAITGGNYLLGNKGTFTKTPIELSAGAELDFGSDILRDDVIKLLDDNGIKHKFEYVRNRGNVVQLRPTSRKYIELTQTDAGLTAHWVKPNLQAGFMELHKGHGPTLFKTYQKIVALGLIGVVLGGFLVGFLAPAYRRKTLIATGLGAAVFIVLVWFA
ncbi:MAG: hypothetical protein HKN36_01675 [Hellea sp.]|nr:hypothetical protein [Hellea sp.]